MNLLHSYRLWKWNRKMKNTRMFGYSTITKLGEEPRIAYEILPSGWELIKPRSWNKFGHRYFNPKTVSYTVDLEKLSAFIEGKKLR